MPIDTPRPAGPPDPARLTACPDCGGRVSTAAPVCIHCGRPLAAAAPIASPVPAPHADKPMAGIVTALVLAALAIFQVVRRQPAPSEAMRNVNFALDTLHTTGNAALVAFALLSLAGRRAAHRAVRGLSVGMIILLCAGMVLAWKVVLGLTVDDPRPVSPGVLAGFAVLTTLFQVAPWVLILYLFRGSRYP